ncbi:MAG: hypothetical protein QM679_11225 [Patulibacter sp.]
MTPYVEAQVLAPQPARRWLAVAAVALLIAPVSVWMPGGPTDVAVRGLSLLAIALVAPLLGFALAPPRQTLTIDGDQRMIVRRTVGELPNPRAREERWPLAAARHAELVERGPAGSRRWGVRVELAGGPPLELETFADRDLAQNTLDHLVLLGIPGTSRAKLRDASLTARPPAIWL